MMRKLPNSLYLGHASYVCSTVTQATSQLPKENAHFSVLYILNNDITIEKNNVNI